MVGGHHRHRLAHIADLPVGQHGLVGVLEPVVEPTGHVVGQQHGVDPGSGQRRADVDAGDVGRGVGRAQGVAPQEVVGPQVGGEGEPALHLGHAVGAPHIGAHSPGAGVDDGVGIGNGVGGAFGHGVG